LFDLVDVHASGVDSFANPSFRVTVTKVRDDCFAHRGAGNILRRDQWDALREPTVVLLE